MPKTKRAIHPGRLHRSKAFEVPGLPGRYPLTVYLPPGFADGRAFPVAYMLDGQNLFGDEGSFSGGWHLHKVLDERAAKGKTVPIVVGIHHGGASRMEELSPWAIARGSRGRADALLDWITGRLSAMVEEEMPVLKGPQHTLLGGSSLGGLCAMYGLAKHPDRFGSALVMSPAFWVRRGAIFGVVEHARLTRNTRVYLDCGGREGHAFAQAEHMARLLTAKGLEPDESLLWRPDKRGSHNERNWRRRLPKALRFLYDAP